MVIVIIGAQWGDEGKGKVVDFLAQRADMVVRAQGGNNAGHTVVTEAGEFKFQLVPSGILHPEVTCVIGNGVVADPRVLIREIEQLRERGLEPGNLVISERASPNRCATVARRSSSICICSPGSSGAIGREDTARLAVLEVVQRYGPRRQEVQVLVDGPHGSPAMVGHHVIADVAHHAAGRREISEPRNNQCWHRNSRLLCEKSSGHGRTGAVSERRGDSSAAYSDAWYQC